MSGPARRHARGRGTRLASGAAVVGLALGGCALFGEDEPPTPEPNRTVEVVDAQLEEADIERGRLPYPFAELPAFTPGWDDLPRYAGGVFLGLEDAGGVLEFTAVDAHGRQLWRTQRPASCSGYVLASAGGGGAAAEAAPAGDGAGGGDAGAEGAPDSQNEADGGEGTGGVPDDSVAILTDAQTTDDAIAQVTATGYDLATGEERWGPVAVPGPHQGPGPVFAAAAPASAVGEGGPRQALDPFTGEVIADEAADENLTIIGVFDDVLLTATGPGEGDGSEVVAQVAEPGGAQLWRLPASELDPSGERSGPVGALAGVDAVAGHAVLTIGGGGPESTGAVIDLGTGQVLETGVRDIAFDHASDMLVSLDAQALAGFAGGEPQWSRGVAEDMSISAVGGVLGYLRSETSVQIVNTMTGEDAVAYPPEARSYAVPAVITPSGAGIFALDEVTLLGLPPGPQS